MKRSGILTTVIVFSLVLVVVLAVVVLRGSNSLLEECPEKYSERLGHTQEQIHYWHQNSPVMTKYWKKEAEIDSEKKDGIWTLMRYESHSSVYDISGLMQYSFIDEKCVKIIEAWVGNDVNEKGFKAVLNEFLRIRDLEKLITGEEKNSSTKTHWETTIEVYNDFYKGQVAVREFRRYSNEKKWILSLTLEKRKR